MRFVLAPKPAAASHALRVVPTRIHIASRPLRVLDFDVEARPLHWISGDYVSKEITAIAWAWVDKPARVTCKLLGDVDPIDMLRAFVDAFNQADLVTGHFIRGYDLPMVNGALTEYGLPALGDKLAHDTKLDLVRRQGLSGSQENLGTMLGLTHPKVKMDQATWRSANRLTKAGLRLVRERVVGDVRQHIELRDRLMQLGYLSAPKIWRSNSTEPLAAYAP